MRKAELQRVGESERTSIHWFSPKWPQQLGLGQAETRIQKHMWAQGAQILGQSSTACQ